MYRRHAMTWKDCLRHPDQDICHTPERWRVFRQGSSFHRFRWPCWPMPVYDKHMFLRKRRNRCRPLRRYGDYRPEGAVQWHKYGFRLMKRRRLWHCWNILWFYSHRCRSFFRPEEFCHVFRLLWDRRRSVQSVDRIGVFFRWAHCSFRNLINRRKLPASRLGISNDS